MRWLARLWRWIAGSPNSVSPSAPTAQATRPALWSDVEAVVALLEKHRVEYVLIGGYALLANGLARQTGDIDILVNDAPENNRRWIAALGELPDGAAKELSGNDRPFVMEAAAEDAELDEGQSAPGVIRINDVITVDVMPRACGLSYQDLKPHITRVARDSREMNVLNLEGLLRTKQGVRPKDQADRQRLEWAISRRDELRGQRPGSDDGNGSR